MITTIRTDTRTVSIGEVAEDLEGDGVLKILFDVTDSIKRTIYSDIPLVELLAALSRIPGVTASYDQLTTWENINALGEHAVIRFVSRTTGTPESITWSRRGDGIFYSCSGMGLVESIANKFDVLVEFEGIK